MHSQAMGTTVESIYVEELGETLSRKQIFKALVADMMEGAIEVDWRDFFPYLKWIPNPSMERKIQRMSFYRKVVMKALIDQQKQERLASGKVSFLCVNSETFVQIFCNIICLSVWDAGSELLH